MSLRTSPFVVALVAIGAMATIALACDTPVYRYAMYRWLPVPYELYCFHRGERSAAGLELEAKVEAMAADVKPSVNLVFIPVDLEKDAELKTVPPDIAALWKSEEAKEVESYLLVSPHGRQIFRGQLAPSVLDELTDSPQRRKIAEELARGKAGVFILLTSSGKEPTEKAEELLGALAADVRAGKIDLYVAPETEGVDELAPADRERIDEALPVPRGGKKGSAEKKESVADKQAKNPPEMGIVVVRRDDPKEAWLVRQLLGLEPDLPELDQPMVFTAFGRGRVTPPLVGKGIHRKNLEESLHYVTGACVCTVRDQNPGIDLLTRFDWTAAAEKMAAQHSSEEGARFALRDLQIFPETSTSEPPMPGGEEKKSADKKAVSKPVEAPPKVSDAVPPAVPPEKVREKAEKIVPDSPATPTSDLLFWLGGGLAVAVVVVAAATWWLLRGAS